MRAGLTSDERARLAAIRWRSSLAATSGRPPFAMVPHAPRLRAVLLASSGQWASLVALSQGGLRA